jgi:coproporphyrinogen III oxidase
MTTGYNLIPAVDYSDEHAPMRHRMAAFVKSLQDEIVKGLESLDGKSFKRDQWEREEGIFVSISLGFF